MPQSRASSSAQAPGGPRGAQPVLGSGGHPRGFQDFFPFPLVGNVQADAETAHGVRTQRTCPDGGGPACDRSFLPRRHLLREGQPALLPPVQSSRIPAPFSVLRDPVPAGHLSGGGAPSGARHYNSQKAPGAHDPARPPLCLKCAGLAGHVGAARVTRTNTRSPRFPGRAVCRGPWLMCLRRCRGPAATWTTTRRRRCCGGRRGPGRRPGRARRS